MALLLLQAVSHCRVLTEKNARLVADNDSLASQVRPGEHPLAKTESMKSAQNKGLLSRFRGSLRKRCFPALIYHHLSLSSHASRMDIISKIMPWQQRSNG